MLFAAADWLVRKWIARTGHLHAARDNILRQELNFLPFFGVMTEKKWSFGICVVYTKTIIHLNVAESGVKTIHLHFGEQLIIILQST